MKKILKKNSVKLVLLFIAVVSFVLYTFQFEFFQNKPKSLKIKETEPLKIKKPETLKIKETETLKIKETEPLKIDEPVKKDEVKSIAVPVEKPIELKKNLKNNCNIPRDFDFNFKNKKQEQHYLNNCGGKHQLAKHDYFHRKMWEAHQDES